MHAYVHTETCICIHIYIHIQGRICSVENVKDQSISDFRVFQILGTSVTLLVEQLSSEHMIIMSAF